MFEADPDGGVLGARYGVGVDPGAISLGLSGTPVAAAPASTSMSTARDSGRSVLLVPGTGVG